MGALATKVSVRLVSQLGHMFFWHLGKVIIALLGTEPVLMPDELECQKHLAPFKRSTTDRADFLGRTRAGRFKHFAIYSPRR